MLSSIYSNVNSANLSHNGGNTSANGTLADTSHPVSSYLNVSNKVKQVVENDYMNHSDMTQLLRSNLNNSTGHLSQSTLDSRPTSSHLLNPATPLNVKVGLHFDDNSDYAVIDSAHSNVSLENGPKSFVYSREYMELLAKKLSLPINNQLYADQLDHSVPSSTADVSPNGISSNFGRTQLQQSLTEAKKRVAQLKRELDANYNLLTIIDKYYTRGDEATAIEV